LPSDLSEGAVPNAVPGRHPRWALREAIAHPGPWLVDVVMESPVLRPRDHRIDRNRRVVLEDEEALHRLALAGGLPDDGAP
jgi:hypothetical protein